MFVYVYIYICISLIMVAVEESMEASLSSLLKLEPNVSDPPVDSDKEKGGYGDNDEIDEYDEGDDEDEESDYEEEEDRSEWDRLVRRPRVPEWGIDSFDDSDYNSPEEDDFSDEETEKQFRRYRRQLNDTKGFYVDRENVPPDLFQGIWPINLETITRELGYRDGLDARQYLTMAASKCLEKYNQEKGLNVKFEHLVRANINGSSGVKVYITFMARESPDGELVEYQAKTQRFWVESDTHPILCRPSPKNHAVAAQPSNTEN